MSLAIKILPHYTYDDWLNWEGQWELIDGFPYAMSPMPVPKHQRIANALGGEFYLRLKECINCKAYQAIDYKISDDTIVQPDMLIVCKPITKKFLDFPPALVVEILSPSTALKDRHSKFDIYENQRIPYYLIVSPDTEEVEVFVLENDKYVLQQKGRNIEFDFSFESECKTSIDFKEIW